MKSLSLLGAIVVAQSAMWSSPTLLAADQSGAEKTKRVVKATVVGQVTGENPDKIGNIEVTYADGTKDRWTTKGNAGLPAVAPDRTVGWTVYGPETQIAASYTLRPNGNITMCRRGKVLYQVSTTKGFVGEWQFIDDGKRFVVETRGAHGAATIELRDTNTGKLLSSVMAYEEKLPKWAEPYRQR